MEDESNHFVQRKSSILRCCFIQLTENYERGNIKVRKKQSLVLTFFPVNLLLDEYSLP